MIFRCPKVSSTLHNLQEHSREQGCLQFAVSFYIQCDNTCTDISPQTMLTNVSMSMNTTKAAATSPFTTIKATASKSVHTKSHEESGKNSKIKI